jgi:hypothetical protein
VQLGCGSSCKLDPITYPEVRGAIHYRHDSLVRWITIHRASCAASVRIARTLKGRRDGDHTLRHSAAS